MNTRRQKEAEEHPILAPRQNAALLGHEDAENQLLDRWNAGNLPHALLITGAQGIGKATLAYRFARFVLEGGASAQGGGLFGDGAATLAMSEENPLFKRVAAGSHGDLLTIEPAFDEKKGTQKREILVDETRRVGEFMSLTPAESEWRVVVIDSVDQLNRNAANAILKILEEPPSQALLLLVSHNPGSLLPTIRSRCQVLKLRPPTLKQFETILLQSRPDIPAQHILPLRQLAAGSPGTALKLHDEGALALYSRLIETFGNKGRVTIAQVQSFADASTGRGGAAWDTLTLLIETLLTRMVQCATGAIQPELVEGEEAAMQAACNGKPLDYWLTLWEKARSLLNDTSRAHLDARQAVLSLLHAVEGSELT